MVATIILLYFINKKYGVNYKKTFYNSTKIILCSAIMLITLKIVSLFLPIDSITRGGALIEIGIYSIIGAAVYTVTTFKSGTIDNVMGDNFINRITTIIQDKISNISKTK